MNKNETRRILITGVGGQGILLAGRVIGNLAARRGYDVKVSEVHGMAQRGGGVVTYVKYADSVASPLIGRGEADVMIAFEMLEAARWMEYMKHGAKAAVNRQRINPTPVISGSDTYPNDIEARLAGVYGAVFIDALPVALRCGSARSVNFVLLGAASGYLDFTRDEWVACIKATTPPKALEINLAAFEAGVGASVQ